jgi:hypothetical protein
MDGHCYLTLNRRPLRRTLTHRLLPRPGRFRTSKPLPACSNTPLGRSLRGRDVDALRRPRKLFADRANHAVVRSAKATKLPNEHGAFYSVRWTLRVYARRS